MTTTDGAAGGGAVNEATGTISQAVADTTRQDLLVDVARRLGPDQDLEHLDDDAIASAVTTGAAELAAATARWLAVLAELVVRGVWARDGARSPAVWLSWACGIGASTAREHVRVAVRLRECPLVAERFAAGRLSYSKVRAITRVCSPEVEPMLLAWADAAPAAVLERIVASARDVQRAASPGPARDDLGATDRWRDDGTYELTLRADPATGVVIEQHLDRLVATAEHADARAAADAAGPATDSTREDAPDHGPRTAPSPRPTRAQRRMTAVADALAAAVAAGPTDTTGADRHTVVLHLAADALTTDPDHGDHRDHRDAPDLDDELTTDRDRGADSDLDTDASTTDADTGTDSNLGTDASTTDADHGADPDLGIDVDIGTDSHLGADPDLGTDHDQGIGADHDTETGIEPDTEIGAETGGAMGAATDREQADRRRPDDIPPNAGPGDERDDRAARSSASAGSATRSDERPDGTAARPSGRVGAALVRDGRGRVRAMSTRQLRRMACSPRLLVVVHGDGSTADLGRTSREPDARLRRLLYARDRTCRFPGCGATLRLHAHHVVWWSHGGDTDLDNLILLCRHHHGLVHDDGWQLHGAGPGRWTFHPPPDHPAAGDGPWPARLDGAGASAEAVALAAAVHAPDITPTCLRPPHWDGTPHDHEMAVGVLLERTAA